VFSFIAAEKASYPVAVLCRVLKVNRTSFHDWERRAPSDRALTDAWLTEKIRQIHQDSRGVYGSPRIHAELQLEHKIRVGRKRVVRLMKAAGISGVKPRKRWRTTIRIPGITPATDLVERQFRPNRPNVLWVADITYLRTGEGWLYLAAVQTPILVRSLAGRWPRTCVQPWSSTRCRWRSLAGAPDPVSFITPIRARST
jgi:putative transposase